MANHYPANLLRTLRNRIPIDAVIVDMLRLDIRPDDGGGPEGLDNLT
jgi:hypothetical protein